MNKGLTSRVKSFKIDYILSGGQKKNCRRNTELAAHIVLLRSSNLNV